jgi:RimJ/RimL family protein N-acetyltransferase
MISGKKVRLRAFREDDLKNVVAWINNPVVTRYLSSMRPWSAVEERAWLERAMRNDDPTAVTFVVESADGE